MGSLDVQIVYVFNNKDKPVMGHTVSVQSGWTSTISMKTDREGHAVFRKIQGRVKITTKSKNNYIEEEYDVPRDQQIGRTIKIEI